MKKFLLTAALILALVTSLTAGTMAYYSASVETMKTAITTKEFSFDATKDSDSFNATIDLAPGDTVTYKVKVTNDSEVRTDATLTAAIVYKNKAGATLTTPGLSVTISSDDESTKFTTNGTYSAKAETLMAVTTEETTSTTEYTIVIK